MGGDGGSFSGRAEMVRTKGFKFLRNLGGMGYTPNTQIRAGDERLGKNENRDLRNTVCALSEEKLRPPLVACRVGRLYNKETVITAMLEKSLPPHMKHVKSLKDMRECEVEVNAATGFPICPVTKADLSSGVRASIIWPCGFLISNRALEAMTQKDTEGTLSGKNDGELGKPKITGTFVCPLCSKEHNAADDLIPLSPDEEETALLLEKALAQMQARKATKKQKASKPDPVTPGSEPRPLQQATSSKSSPVADPSKGADPPASEISVRNEVKAVPPKRLRDWVLESEPVFAAASTSKERRVAT